MSERNIIPPERLAAVEERLLRAEAPADFVPTLAVEWSRSTRCVWKYVAIVRARLAKRHAAAKLSPEADAEMIRALLLRAYRAAEVGGPHGSDAKGMVAAAKALGEVTGVVGPRKVEITGKDGGPVAMAAQVVMLPTLEISDAARHDSPDGALAPESGASVALPGLSSE